MADFMEIVAVHHFELAIALALVAVGLKFTFAPLRERVMPMFFGVSLSPLLSIAIFEWDTVQIFFPCYLLERNIFALKDPIVSAMYFPGWGLCAVMALLHPLVGSSKWVRALLWVFAVSLEVGQACLIFSSGQLR